MHFTTNVTYGVESPPSHPPSLDWFGGIQFKYELLGWQYKVCTSITKSMNTTLGSNTSWRCIHIYVHINLWSVYSHL